MVIPVDMQTRSAETGPVPTVNESRSYSYLGRIGPRLTFTASLYIQYSIPKPLHLHIPSSKNASRSQRVLHTEEFSLPAADATHTAGSIAYLLRIE